MHNFSNTIYRLWDKGLFHMLGSKIINQLIVFCGGMLLVRILNKEDYGIYSYVQNILAFFLLLDGFGATSGLLQFGSKNFGNQKMSAYFKLSMRQAIIANIMIGFLIIFYAVFYIQDLIISKLLILAAFIPLFNVIVSIFQIYNIVCRENIFFSIFTNVNTILITSGLLIGAYLGKVMGIYILKYIATILTIIIGIIFLYKNRFKYLHTNTRIDRVELKEYQKFSIIALGSNVVSQIVLILDIFLIGQILDDMNALASYKVATLIPFGLFFLPTTFISFVYPYFAKNSDNLIWVKKNYLNLIKLTSVCFFLLTLILISTSQQLLPIIFGEQYHDSILPYNILCIGFFLLLHFVYQQEMS